jgi:arsenite methyltransferase
MSEVSEMSETPIVDVDTLRSEVRDKYRAVAEAPDAIYHFHTGRPLAMRLGYDPAIVDKLPDRAVESFAGVGNPFSLRTLGEGERVVDVGSGAGFDSFVAAHHVGEAGAVVGVDMTDEMLTKSQRRASCSVCPTSSSATASPKRCRSKTAGPMR